MRPTRWPVGPLLAALLAARGYCSRDFAESLFDGALPYAMESLNGRFIAQLADGTLPKEAFDLYLQQDNLYLSQYARAFAVLGAKAEKTDEMVWLVNMSLEYLHEHGEGANEALDQVDFERDASPVTVAYTSFFLQAAWGEDNLLGYAAVLPCQKLYDWLFAELNASGRVAPHSPYRGFVEQYADPRNHELTLKMESYVNRYAVRARQDIRTRAQLHYNRALQYEAEFFDQALQPGASSRAGRPAEAAGGQAAPAAATRLPRSTRRSLQSSLPQGTALGGAAADPSGFRGGRGLDAASALAPAIAGGAACLAVAGAAVVSLLPKFRQRRDVRASAGVAAPFVSSVQ